MSRSKKIIISLIVALSAIILAASIAIVVIIGGKENDGNFIPNASSNIVTAEKIDEPIDFEKLWQTNEDIYAWIRVPNTNIDYPILQHKTNDEFYLHHNIYGKYEYAGAIYSEKRCNTKDFTDKNTMLYGHNMTKGYMFENLHKLQDEVFFNKCTEFYIYTPEKKMTYKIVSAFQYNNYHIMYSFDFTTDEGYQQYIDTIKKPGYATANVREEIEVTTDDKLVTLSTCLGDGKKYRYLVVGVLSDIEEIK